MILAVAAALGLAGCGRKGRLEPPPGQQLVDRRTARRQDPGHVKPKTAVLPRSPAELTAIRRASHAPFRLSRRRAPRRGRAAAGRSPRAVGTPFYCYSTATLRRHYASSRAAFADVPSLVCYAMKANSNLAVLRMLAKLGAGMDVVSEGELRRARAAGVPAEQDHVLRRRQDGARDRLRARRRTSSASTSSPSPSSSCCPQIAAIAGRARRASRCASTPTSTPGPTARSPPASRRTSSASRSRRPAPSMPGRRACRASRSPASTCISAARSPTLEPYRRVDRAAGRPRPRAARRRPRASTMSISAAASASPIATTTSRRPIRTTMPPSSSATPGSSAPR